MADTMKVQFKTKVTADGKHEPAGKVHALPAEKAKAYIDRGLAVEVKAEAKPAAEKPAEKKPADQPAK